MQNYGDPNRYSHRAYPITPDDGAHVAPEFAPPPLKKRTHPALIVFCVLAGILALCGVGGAIAAAVGGSTPAPAGSGAPAAPDLFGATKPKITMTGCSTNEFGTVTITYTLVNQGKIAQSFAPRFDLFNSAGEKVGDAYDYTSDVAAGGTFKGSATGLVSQGQHAAKCQLREW